MQRIYSIAVLLFWCGCAVVTHIPIQVSTVKPKESDFRNYKILKISELNNRPVCEATNEFPNLLKQEIKGRKLFKTVQTITSSDSSSSTSPDDSQTLILKLSVVEFYPGEARQGVWQGGHIVIQCSLVEKATNSEIFNCKLRGPVGSHMEEDTNLGLESVTEAMAKQIANVIQQGW